MFLVASLQLSGTVCGVGLTLLQIHQQNCLQPGGMCHLCGDSKLPFLFWNNNDGPEDFLLPSNVTAARDHCNITY